ncbi:MAG: PQQ-binding-like beta-propeller repeat protein [Verrucomicrobia bacterium]|nr:PQQ-binding-like beta-propeller repeat protein [Verrucomicrobiota bacterium]
MKCRDFVFALSGLAMLGATSLPAGDWPQWRFDANRSADSPEDLPAELHLQWTRAFAPRLQAWDDPLNNDLMTYDRTFEPVVLGDRMFIGFNDRDKVVALDTETGRERWSFFTDGPVRLPPAAWKGKVYFVSDDGHLYCVRADDGALVWKFRGGPSARKALGNGRVVSAWPARGGPVVRDDQVYFAASLWPFMGTFIYALDAQTGRIIWVNDGTGAQYIKQPHSAPSFAGVAPQGALVATKDFLLVPGGRSVPAAFDRKSGKFLYYQLDDNGKGNGGSFVLATETEFFVHTRQRGTRSFELKNGKKSTFTLNEPVLATNRLYSAQDAPFLKTAVLDAEGKLAGLRQTEFDNKLDVSKAQEDADTAAYKKATNSLASTRRKISRAEADLATARKNLGTNWPGSVLQAVGADKKVRWEVRADGSGDLIKAGQRLYLAGTNAIVAFQLQADKTAARLVWSNHVEGRVARLLAANGKLFAVTLDGRIMAFGRKPVAPEPDRWGERAGEPGRDPAPTGSRVRSPHQFTDREQDQKEQEVSHDGHALWFGIGNGELLEAFLRHSKLHVTAVDEDAAKVEAWRRRFDAAGLYGRRVVLHVGDPASFKAPPYIANLVVVGQPLASRVAEHSFLQAAYESVRPYGGLLWVLAAPADAPGLAEQIKLAALPNARLELEPNGVTVAREGALPGAAGWTHQYGNVGNTVKSDDRLVKLPLGVLWFGGVSHTNVLPRHGHGPSEQVVAGRLFLEGMNNLSARDVYTGRVLWNTEFGDLGNYGVYYDFTYTNLPLATAYNQRHIAGANARGANFVATEDEVYVVVSNACRVLDARTGQPLRTIELPPRPNDPEPPQWGYLGVYGDVLLAGSGFAHYTKRLNLWPTNSLMFTNPSPSIVDLSASRGLVAFNRHTGDLLWRAEARHSFVHNGIVAGNGRVYCLDRAPKSTEDKLKRRGRTATKDYRLLTFDARTGWLLWEETTNVFGTWLGYSERHDVLLQAGATATDRLKDEAERGMITYRGASGSMLWSNLAVKYTGPCILHNDTILTTPISYKTNSGAFGLLDGQARTVKNPLTGESEPLRIYRTYGCNYPVACEHLVTFRSGAAGFYDLESHSGTGNFGGFKSGCSANLIAADGVLNAPDYTRTCSCPYQNQTSLAFVHVPDLARELEVWTHNQYGADAKDGVRVKRLGINFGAPGDRLSETGTLWVDHPNVSGSSPNLSVIVKGTKTNYFRRHSVQLSGEGPAWVMASGVADAETILIGPESRKQPPPPPAAKKKTEEEEEDKDKEDESKTTAKATNAPPAKGATALTSTNKVEAPYKSKLTDAPYTVRLYFAEPEDLRAGDRVFSVKLQDRAVLEEFDIVAAAGGSRRGLVKEFRGVIVKEQLAIALSRARNSKSGPILNGVEMILEKTIPRDTDLPGGG